MPTKMVSTDNIPVPLNLNNPITSRDGTLLQDSKMVNCFAEQAVSEPDTVKRPGLVTLYNLPAGVAQGQFTCNGISYAITNGVAYNITTGAAIPIPSANSASGLFEVLSDTPYGTSVLKTSTAMWIMTGLSIVQVTDANYPPVTVPGLVYLDGSYYVMTPNGTLQSSALQTPSSWPALNFVQVDVSLGAGTGLLRQLNYIVALCINGTQFFYDAGNASGIPLGTVSNACWRTGCPNGNAAIELQDNLIFISTNTVFGRTVTLITTGLVMELISDSFISKVLNRSNMSAVYAFGIKTTGHAFYVVTITDINTTLVYDIDTQQWYVWTSVVNGTEQCFYPTNYFNNGSYDLFQDPADGCIYSMTPTAYQDYGNPINVLIRTPMLTWGTMSRKFISELSLIADTVSTIVQMRYTDDDYQTWSSYANIDMSTVRKMVNRLGSTRRRAFDFFHSSNTPLRINSGELIVNKGSS